MRDIITADLHTDNPPDNVLYEMLRYERRRLVLKVLFDHGPMERADLAKYVAAVEYGKPIDELEHDELQNVRTTLLQHHLPPLADHKFIVWDRHECEDCESTMGTDIVSFGTNCHLLLCIHTGINIENGPQWLVDRIGSAQSDTG